MPALPPFLNAPSRQVAAAAAAIAVTVVLTTGIAVWENRQRTQAKAEGDTRNVARLLSEHAGQTFDAIDGALRAVDRLRTDVERGIYRSQASIHVNLRTLRGGSPVLSDLSWFDAYGERVATSAYFNPARLNVAGLELFHAPAERPDPTVLHVAAPLPSDENGEGWLIGVSRRMEHTDRSFAGVASGTVDPRTFMRVFGSLELATGYTITLVRNDGIILAQSPPGGSVPGSAWPGRDLPDRLEPDGTSATYSTPASDDIASYATVPRMHGRLLIDVRVTRTAAFAEFRRDLAIAVVEAALGLTVLFIGTRLIVNGLRRREELQAALAEAVDHAREAEAEAEAANRAKSDFLARMSHELRTPLNAVLGFGQMIALDPSRTLSEKQREYCGYILTSGQHLLDLINEVLDLAGVDSGRMRMAQERIATLPFLNSVAAVMHPAAGKAGVIVDIAEADGIPDLTSDPLRLRQVLINLVGNAIKYNHVDGRVTMSASAVAGGRVRIAVTDTGHGIPADRQGGLFAPFERLGAEHSDIEGTGLGLALSKRLVEAMGGAIGFVSAAGHGSTFWIDLPADGATAGSPADRDAAA